MRSSKSSTLIEIPTAISNLISRYGGPFLVTMMDKDAIFDCPALDCLANHDDQWYKALTKINSFKSALLNASPHEYSTPSKEMYQTLSEVTSVCVQMLGQSVFISIEDAAKAVYLRIASEAHRLICSSSPSAERRKMLLWLFSLCARGMGEDPSLSNCIENLIDHPSSAIHLDETILAFASDRFLRIIPPYDDDDDSIPGCFF